MKSLEQRKQEWFAAPVRERPLVQYAFPDLDSHDRELLIHQSLGISQEGKRRHDGIFQGDGSDRSSF